MALSLRRAIHDGISILLLALALVCLFPACGGGDDGPGDDGETPQITFEGIVEGDDVSQTENLKVSVTGTGTVTSLMFMAPTELVGRDEDSSAEVLQVQWDTTAGENGPVEIKVEAVVSGATITQTMTVNRNNYSAGLSANYSKDDYVRNGAQILLDVSALPFGPSASLNRVEVRELSGTNSTSALPIVGTYNSAEGTYGFELGTPVDSEVVIRVNAVNYDGLISEPLILELGALRDDIITYHLPYDFEITPDGNTGVILSKLTGSDELMRLELLDLGDPVNPYAPSGSYVDLNVGNISPDLEGLPVGNVLMAPSGNKVYVLFPSAKFYSVDLSTRTAMPLDLEVAVRDDAGVAYTHSNRAPYAVITPDGKYVVAVESGTPSLTLVNVTDMYQETGGSGTTDPLACPGASSALGCGLMAVHPNGSYLYVVNNWGAYSGAGITAKVSVFDFNAKKFIDAKTGTPSTVDSFEVESASSTYKIAQQPVVTPDLAWLAVSVCDTTLTSTTLRLMDLRANPSTPTQGASFDLGAIGCGTIATVSGDSRYVVIVSQDADKLIAVVDIISGVVMPITYDTGAVDAVIADIEGDSVPDFIYTQNINFTNRSMGELDLSATTKAFEDLSVPSASGLAPPGGYDEIGYNHLLVSGYYVYELYAAYAKDSSGAITLQGGSLSVFDVSIGDFVFPNPID